MLALFVYSIMVLGVAVGAIVFSTLLGRPTHNPHKDMPYESGITPTGEARIRTTIPYYVVALFFILFDVEAVFLYAWAIRAHELSWAGFFKAFVFLTFLFAGLVYVWLRGGLAWRRLSSKVSGEASSSHD